MKLLRTRTTLGAALALGVAALSTACARSSASGGAPAQEAQGALPRTHAPRPTTAAINAADLMTRLYIFADDSMEGRRAGSPGAARADAYIVRELQRLGLRPAGDNGTFFQDVPLVSRGFDASLTLNADGGVTLRYGTDFMPTLTRGTPRSVDGAQVVYGGEWGATPALTAEQLRGRIVLLTAPAGSTMFVSFPRLAGTAWAEAAAVALVNLDQAGEPMRRQLRAPSLAMRAGTASSSPNTPLPMHLTRTAAEALLGRSLDGATVGTTGRTIRGAVAPTETTLPARNIVAVLPGSDERLRGQYVALGAHSDHVGYREQAADHDSLRAFNRAVWEQRGRFAGAPALPADRRAAIRVNVDSLRQASPARRDSINNGADDDGSGSMALLEIAEAMTAAAAKPRRSVLFVWHTGEELGLLGAQWFTDNPTVPRDSIVAQLNIDMIGRGTARDTRNGGPDFVGILGSRRLSTQLGDLAEQVNRERRQPLRLDYELDADGHPENLYCRSDHYMYARYGIPIAFFFTGLHEDYHQVTDEPQYIDYPHYASITQYIHDLAARVASLDQRPVVDKPKPDPRGTCRQ